MAMRTRSGHFDHRAGHHAEDLVLDNLASDRRYPLKASHAPHPTITQDTGDPGSAFPQFRI